VPLQHACDVLQHRRFERWVPSLARNFQAQTVVASFAECGPLARQRIKTLLKDKTSASPDVRVPQDLEAHNFQDVAPAYNQIVAMFNSVFGFVSLLMVVVTLFSVANTVNMAVSERTAEVGTLQALGLKQRHIRALFIVEGGFIGAVGAALGVVTALLVSEYGINPAGFQWTPPGNSVAVRLGIDVWGSDLLCVGVVATLTLIACVSS
jgi:putative ABC transport system permease protein